MTESRLKTPEHSTATDVLDEDDLVPADDRIIGRAFRWSVAVFLVLGGGIAGMVWLLGRPSVAPVMEPAVFTPPQRLEAAAAVRLPEATFADITIDAGIDFIHENGAAGEKLLPETMGGGCAFLDFDGDGDQDILLVNSAEWSAAPDSPRPRSGRGIHALYRNDGRGRFTNVTVGSGLDVSFYGMGAAVGDYDGDGDSDVFISAVGPNHLFRNEGGVFRDVTLEAGVAGDEREWSTSSAFFDADRDGDLDLFVCNYVRWSREIDFAVDYQLTGLGRAYGPPTNFEGTFPCLYRNNGDGTFTDLSAASGVQVRDRALGRPMAKALGVRPVDLDEDGFIDLLLANDTVQKFLLHNQGDGTFLERGAEFGLAFDRNGNATGAMGVDAAHYRNDASLGICIGNFANEMSSLYVSQGGPTQFADEAIGEGIGAPTRRSLTFGVLFLDYDLDGRLDLLHANGHIEDEINTVQPSQTYRQPAQLFWNAGPAPGEGACFVEVPGQRLGALAAPIVGRGAAYADIDGDGDLDVLLTQAGGRPVLLRNDQHLGHRWLRVKLLGAAPNTEAIGARVELVAVSGGGERLVQRRCLMPTRSYLSSVELPLTFGLGPDGAVELLRVIWPDGSIQVAPVEGVDRLVTVRQALR
jgi:hypothetical protein